MDIISYALSKGNTQKAVTDYLDEHLTNPTNPPIDTSLSIAGAAADSKAAGDKLSELKEDLTAVEDGTAILVEQGYFSNDYKAVDTSFGTYKYKYVAADNVFQMNRDETAGTKTVGIGIQDSGLTLAQRLVSIADYPICKVHIEKNIPQAANPYYKINLYESDGTTTIHNLTVFLTQDITDLLIDISQVIAEKGWTSEVYYAFQQVGSDSYTYDFAPYYHVTLYGFFTAEQAEKFNLAVRMNTYDSKLSVLPYEINLNGDVLSLSGNDGSHSEITLPVSVSPSKNIGFAWETGNIDVDTGLDASDSTKLRSQYVPVEEGKTYAFYVDECENAYNEYVFYYTADKTPILIDTDNNRYYTRWGMGWYPKTLTIPTGFNVAYIRVRMGTNAFNYNHAQAEENVISTSFRSHELGEQSNENMPNNINGYIGKRILLFGDSITAQNNWSRWFEASVKPSQLYNYAVGGASWCDPTSGVIYDGTATPNVIGNQVQKAINNSLANIDCIIILAGTNDTNVTFPTDQDIESAFFDDSMNAVALADVDKTTWQGAMRWSLEKLITTFPNAKIFVCSPVQRVYTSAEPVLSLYSTIKGKCETIEKMSKRMGVEFVDTEQCGISACRSLYFADGLHPNVRGAEKIARYIIARYMAHFCQN